MSSKKAVIIINPSCHQGRGWKRWLSIRGEVQKRLRGNCKEVVLEKGLTLREILYPYLQGRESTLVVSAGGDGSLHYLVNHLLKEEKENIRHVVLGAIGLGSSNDFLKPFDEKIKAVPVRICQSGGTVMHDAGVATYDDGNMEHKKFFVVNTSVGITAEANWRFNHPGFLLRFLKTKATSAAIIYTAVSTILSYRNTTLLVKYNDKTLHEPVSNINVLKVPFVSGSFFYRQPIMRDDGKLRFNVCMNMSKRELLCVLNQLQKGNFPQNNKKLSDITTDVHISADHRFVFECDGETEMTSSLRVSVLPEAISVLRN